MPGRAVIGCVVPAITPVIRYDSTSFTEFGPHVAGAQASGLRGGSYSNPMHRLVKLLAGSEPRDLVPGIAPASDGQEL
ncbi:hypothetical protein [Microbacterium hominis]|uniref:hypothetical protein n=1 Tax=Microbacterium hominis TaxID=162426 RepID=UPI0009DFEC26|nr:hypothetical protein [Microbacterium hominis]